MFILCCLLINLHTTATTKKQSMKGRGAQLQLKEKSVELRSVKLIKFLIILEVTLCRTELAHPFPFYNLNSHEFLAFHLR